MALLKVALNHEVVEGPFHCYRTPEPCLKKSNRHPGNRFTSSHSLFLPFLFFIDSRKRKLSLFISKI
jgi:hypothetical protein